MLRIAAGELYKALLNTTYYSQISSSGCKSLQSLRVALETYSQDNTDKIAKAIKNR